MYRVLIPYVYPIDMARFEVMVRENEDERGGQMRSCLEQVRRAASAVCRSVFRASNGEVRVTALMDSEDGSLSIECGPHSWKCGCALSTVLDVAYAIKYAANAMGISYRCNAPDALDTGGASEEHPSLFDPRKNIVMRMGVRNEIQDEKKA